MIKYLLSVLLCAALSSCALGDYNAFYHQYAQAYTNAINTGDVTSIANKDAYADIHQRIAADITALGYTTVLYENIQKGLIVIAKPDEAHPSAIILKYTASTGDFKTNIDLVKASDDPITNDLVRNDIQQLAQSIKNE